VDKLIGGLAEPLARRWSGEALGASLVFWAAGALLFMLGRSTPQLGCPPRGPAGSLACRLEGYGLLGLAVGTVMAAAAVIGASLAVAAVAPRVVRLLSGAGWPARGPVRPVARWRVRRQQRRRSNLARVAAAEPGQAGGRERGAAYDRLRWYPGATTALAPTRIGNAFVALGQRIADRYGLDMAIVWEPLLAVLPDPVQGRLAEQSRTVAVRAQAVTWAAAAALWAPLAPDLPSAVAWLAGSVALASVAYTLLLDAVRFYCDLVEGVVSTHRLLLYRAIGLAPPWSTAAERSQGEQLSAFLGVGLRVPAVLAWDDGRENR
jgi:hypothetical protein